MKLLKSQKDILYDLIERNGMSPFQFDFFEFESNLSHGKVATTLKFKESDFFFTFETVGNNEQPHYSIYSPGEYKYEDSHYSGFWQSQYQKVCDWLIYLKREVNTPNKWERLKIEMSVISFTTSNDNSKFSASEYEELNAKIASLKHGIKLLGLLPEQLITLNAKLDYLSSQAKEMNKFDWKSLFIGTIISIIIQLAVTQENAKALWELIRMTFNDFLLP